MRSAVAGEVISGPRVRSVTCQAICLSPSFGLAWRRRSSVGCCDRGGLFRCHHASRRAIKIDANGTFDMRVVSTEIFFEERGDGNGTAEAKSREGHA